MGVNRCGVSERVVRGVKWNIVNGDHVGKWVADRISGAFHPGSVALGLSKDGILQAGVLFEHWNGRSIVAHMAALGWLTPAYVAAIFDYAYNVCGANKVILPVASQNFRSGKFVRKLGFREEARIKDACPEGDIILYTLEKADCRYLASRYQEKIGVA